MEHMIRRVRAEEWAKARELRLEALRDPLAPIAFYESYEQAAEQPDSFWQERTTNAAAGADVVQFVAEAADGRWDGTASVLVEHEGSTRIGKPAPMEQTHVVGVFVRQEARGSGLAEALFRAALEWSWALDSPPVERVRLLFHSDNTRAAGLYRKVGFVPSGAVGPVPDDEMAVEYEIRRPPQGV
ncbi:GNAT family N-acetyltransferase [Streptomyces pristinaespiralis]|uniref:GNAT family N-acetyltransferase n=1 Tax=Streptomyces pristinaespiralis TaxID=38300 RepID=UPI0033FF5B29